MLQEGNEDSLFAEKFSGHIVLQFVTVAVTDWHVSPRVKQYSAFVYLGNVVHVDYVRLVYTHETVSVKSFFHLLHAEINCERLVLVVKPDAQILAVALHIHDAFYNDAHNLVFSPEKYRVILVDWRQCGGMT